VIPLPPFEQELYDKSATWARERMAGVRGSHGWDHVERVLHSAAGICAAQEGSDPFIILTAAALHDIARDEEDRSGGALCHAEAGSREARAFLLRQGLDAPRSEHIARCILTHRFRGDAPPDTMEAMILYDADKLDSIGAVGIGRAFLFSGEIGARLHNSAIDIHSTDPYSTEDTAWREYMHKLRHVKDRLFTEEGRRVARERDRFMELFFRQLHDEVEGKR
jgi:uncharacterized protein